MYFEQGVVMMGKGGWGRYDTDIWEKESTTDDTGVEYVHWIVKK